MADREAKRALFDGFARVAQALASGRRVEILDILANGPRSVETLAQRLGQSVANTSQHLQVLRRAGLVATTRAGTSMTYRLAGPEVFDFLGSLRSLAVMRLAGVDRLAQEYVGSEDAVQRIGRRELAARLKRGDDLVIVDVRPREEYEAGHLPGAVSIPVEELPRRIRTLPKDKPIVTYCRGRFCAFSHVAGRVLRKRGYDVLRLEDGLPEWEAGRLPVERGPSR